MSPGGSVVPGTPPVVVKFLRASRGVRELRRVIASCVCVDTKEDESNTNYANGADLIINADDDRTTNATRRAFEKASASTSTTRGHCTSDFRSF